ncbi:hypothetical protein PLICRDRAFT_43251, partial [Plicaturopsis crispa FD-325 SS-3]
MAIRHLDCAVSTPSPEYLAQCQHHLLVRTTCRTHGSASLTGFLDPLTFLAEAPITDSALPAILDTDRFVRVVYRVLYGGHIIRSSDSLSAQIFVAFNSRVCPSVRHLSAIPSGPTHSASFAGVSPACPIRQSRFHPARCLLHHVDVLQVPLICGISYA